MTKTDYDLVGEAVTDLPIGVRLKVYRRLVRSLSARYEDFDPWKFGSSCNVPPLMRTPNRKKKANARS